MFLSGNLIFDVVVENFSVAYSTLPVNNLQVLKNCLIVGNRWSLECFQNLLIRNRIGFTADGNSCAIVEGTLDGTIVRRYFPAI